MVLKCLAPLRRRETDVYALVYLVESNEPDGSRASGFRPGYIATVWPMDSISKNWVLGRFSEGTEFWFLPREKWGEPGAFRLDVVERSTPTFSLVRE